MKKKKKRKKFIKKVNIKKRKKRLFRKLKKVTKRVKKLKKRKKKKFLSKKIKINNLLDNFKPKFSFSFNNLFKQIISPVIKNIEIYKKNKKRLILQKQKDFEKQKKHQIF